MAARLAIAAVAATLFNSSAFGAETKDVDAETLMSAAYASPRISPVPLPAQARPTPVIVGRAQREAFPQTSVEHHFVRDEVVGAAGFLCGIAPGHNESGGPSARGYDPHGRFIGAQMKVAFR